MNRERQINNFVVQFIEVSKNHDDAYRFIREHRIWVGFFKHGWISRISLVAALIISIHFISTIASWFADASDHMTSLQGTTGFLNHIAGEGKQLFLGSGSKYLLLILLEILTFHCSVKTLNILLGEDFKPRFQDFIQAEKRMIAVAIRSWIYEMIASILIGIALGILGADFLKEAMVFVVSSYFIGFAFFDNYNEQFHLSLKESSKIIRKYAGASIAVGLISYLLMMIPIAGLVMGPIIGSVAAALYFYNQGINLSGTRLRNEIVESGLNRKPS